MHSTRKVRYRASHAILPKFRFTELGSKSAIQLNNKMHNVYKGQKDYVPVFRKLIW